MYAFCYVFTITVVVISLSFDAVKLSDILIDIKCEFAFIAMSKLTKSRIRKNRNTFNLNFQNKRSTKIKFHESAFVRLDSRSQKKDVADNGPDLFVK